MTKQFKLSDLDTPAFKEAFAAEIIGSSEDKGITEEYGGEPSLDEGIVENAKDGVDKAVASIKDWAGDVASSTTYDYTIEEVEEGKMVVTVKGKFGLSGRSFGNDALKGHDSVLDMVVSGEADAELSVVVYLW